MTPAQINFALAKLKPNADESEVLYGIPSSFTVAQACLESNWLTSKLAVNAGNLFGVKADKSWTGDVLSLPTKEQLKDGTWITIEAKWRMYASIAECLKDHAKFFQVNPRYHAALAFPHDGKQFAVEIAKAGYATDQQYAQKLLSIIRTHKLTDVGATK